MPDCPCVLSEKNSCSFLEESGDETDDGESSDGKNAVGTRGRRRGGGRG